MGFRGTIKETWGVGREIFMFMDPMNGPVTRPYSQLQWQIHKKKVLQFGV
jgi:hypothetical protein